MLTPSLRAVSRLHVTGYERPSSIDYRSIGRRSLERRDQPISINRAERAVAALLAQGKLAHGAHGKKSERVGATRPVT